MLKITFVPRVKIAAALLASLPLLGAIAGIVGGQAEAGFAGPLPNDSPTIAFSPDGKFLVTGGFAHEGLHVVEVWDARANKAFRLIECKDGVVRSVAFAPDGESFACGTDKGVVCVWDPGNGMLIRKLKGHAGAVVAVAFTSDGRTIAAASVKSANGKSRCDVRLWDATTGAEKHCLLSGPGQVHGIALSPDGKTLAAAVTNLPNFISGRKRWDVETGKEK